MWRTTAPRGPVDHRHPGRQGGVRALVPGTHKGSEHELLPGRGYADDEGLRPTPPTASPGDRDGGPDTVAAVFLEPVQNSRWLLPPRTLARVICDQYDVLFVADETITRAGASATCSP